MDEKRKKALEDAIAKIEKTCGKGTVMKMDGSSKVETEVISTGNIAVDIATGIGGVLTPTENLPTEPSVTCKKI